MTSPLEMMFPESFNHPTQGFVSRPSSLDQFKAYIDSLIEGKDFILESKDAQAILNKFEKGRELLVLGRVKAKSIETPSLAMSSEYSASVSNYLRGESKDEDDEIGDEVDDLYNYTPLLDCFKVLYHQSSSAGIH